MFSTKFSLCTIHRAIYTFGAHDVIDQAMLVDVTWSVWETMAWRQLISTNCKQGNLINIAMILLMKASWYQKRHRNHESIVISEVRSLKHTGYYYKCYLIKSNHTCYMLLANIINATWSSKSLLIVWWWISNSELSVMFTTRSDN
jgi:hypothetical protein